MSGISLMLLGGAVPADVPEGQQAYTSPGSYSWTAPDGVNSVCVVCIGAGGQNSFINKGLGGGGLGYINDYSVTPGNSYTVVVGAQGNPGGDSYFVNTSTVEGEGGAATGGSYTGDGGGDGGDDGQAAGGGAGGYSGNGGDAASDYGNGSDGSGGGAGGGGQGVAYQGDGLYVQGATGGGTGILGEGTSGEGGGGGAYQNPEGGEGGSGGGDGDWDSSGSAVTGGAYGGGGGVWYHPAVQIDLPGSGGAVRIIWGAGRAFPSTNTADV